jgi:hypothetical protein
MMVHNHFELRWIDGYGAASDAPSELAVRIEEVASNISRALDHVHLAVRSVRLPDGNEVCVGLLQLDVAVPSEQRPVAFLHAAVLPPGHRLDDDRWRALVERRYGPYPEDRIREIYEELAVTTKDKGRKRLRELEIRPEDVREVIGSRASSTKIALAKKGARAGSESGARVLPNAPGRPPTNPPIRPSTIPPLPMPGAAPAGPQRRPSQSSFGPSERDDDESESAETTSGAPIIATPGGGSGSTAELAVQASPSGSQLAIPSSRTHYRGMPLVGFAVSAVAIVAAVWLAIYARELGRERDRLAEELARPRIPVEDAGIAELRGKLEKCQRDFEATNKQLQELRATPTNDVNIQSCNTSLAEARQKLGTTASQISSLEANLANAQTQLALATKTRAEAESRSTEERARLEVERDRLKHDNAQLAGENAKQDQLVKQLCDGLRGSYSSKLLQICKGAK